MRILHTADWHLGRTLYGADLSAAHAAFLDALVECVRENKVDAVLISGDVYDRAFPNLEAVAMLEEAFVRLTELTTVVVTPGNHDSATRLGFGSELFRDRLVMRPRPLDAATPVVIPDADGGAGLLVYPVPYLDPDAARGTLAPWSEQEIHRSHEAVLSTVTRRVSVDLAARRSGVRTPAVLMAHAFVAGGLTTDSERDIRVGGVDAVPSAIFDDTGLDYVALGHLHRPQRVTSAGPVARYAGSPLAFSFSERTQTKSFTLVDLDESGVREISTVDAPVVRSMSEVVGSLPEVLGRRNAGLRDHFVRVIVTENVRPNDLVATVKKVFPYALEVHFLPHGGDIPLPGLSSEIADPLRVLDDFVAGVRGVPATEAERLVLRRAYEDVRRAEGER